MILLQVLLVWKTLYIPKPVQLLKNNKTQRNEIEILRKFHNDLFGFWAII